MIVVDIALFICIFMLGVVVLGHSRGLELINDDLEEFDADIGNLKQRCDAYKELIEALSKSVRELNGVVEEAVKSKEPAPDDKPDMSALIGGWSVDDVRTEIVRCGECARRKTMCDGRDRCALFNVIVDSDGYCKWAERRTYGQK